MIVAYILSINCRPFHGLKILCFTFPVLMHGALCYHPFHGLKSKSRLKSFVVSDNLLSCSSTHKRSPKVFYHLLNFSPAISKFTLFCVSQLMFYVSQRMFQAKLRCFEHLNRCFIQVYAVSHNFSDALSNFTPF